MTIFFGIGVASPYLLAMNMLAMLSMGAAMLQPVRAALYVRLIDPIVREMFFRRMSRGTAAPRTGP